MAKRRRAGSVDVEVNLGVAKISEQVKQANQTLERGFSQFGKTLHRLVNVAVVIYGFRQLQQAASALQKNILELAAAGDRAGTLQENFQALGGTSEMMNRAAEASKGLITQFDLMAQANKLLIADIPNLNENFAEIVGYGAKLGEALGGTAAEGVERLSGALVTATSRQLQSLGIIIDQEKAYLDYAKAQGVAGNALKDYVAQMSQAQQVEARRTAAIEQLKIKSSELSEIGIGVADSAQILENAWSDAFAKMGMGIDSTDKLGNSYKQLAEEVAKIDWEHIGEVVGGTVAIAFGKVRQELADMLPVMQQLVSYWDQFWGITDEGKIKRVEGLIAVARFDIENLEKLGGLYQDRIQGHKDLIDRYELELELLHYIRDQNNKTSAEAIEKQERLKGALKATGDTAQETGKAELAALAETNRATDEAIRKQEQLKNAWMDRLEAGRQAQRDLEIQTAIDSQDWETFRKKLIELRDEVVAKAIKETVDAGITDLQLRDEYVEMMERGTDQWVDRMRQKQIDAHKASVDFWTSAFENAITGATFDLEDALKQIAVGFAAEMMASITGVGGEYGDLKGLGQSLAKELGIAIKDGFTDSETKKALTETISEATAKGIAEGQKTEGQQSGVMGSLQGLGWGMALAGIFSTIQKVTSKFPEREDEYMSQSDREDAQVEETGERIGMAIGTYFGLVFATATGGLGGVLMPLFIALGKSVGDPIGEALGLNMMKHLPNWQHWEQINRDVGLERITEAMGGSEQRYLTAAGDWKPHAISGAGEISAYRYNIEEGFAGDLIPYTLGLGRLFGGEDDKISQDMAIMLANAAGEADSLAEAMLNVSTLFAQLDLSVDEVKDQLTEMFLNGEISLDEFGRGLQGLNGLLTYELGSMEEGFNLLADTIDGPPRRAIQAFGMLIEQAMSEGITDVRGLADYMGERFGPEAAELFDRLADAGMESFDDIVNAGTDEIHLLYSVILDFITEFGELFREGSEEAQKSFSKSMLLASESVNPLIEKLNEALGLLGALSGTTHRRISQALTVDGYVPPDFRDDDVTLLAKGGVLSGLTRLSYGGRFAIAGEAGPEAVLPLRRSASGDLGVIASAGGQGVVFNIDARGASPGTEQLIVSALNKVHRAAVRDSIAIMSDLKQRGLG